MKSSVQGIRDDEAPRIVGYIKQVTNIFKVVGGQDLPTRRIDLQEGMRSSLQEHGDSLLRPMVFVCKERLIVSEDAFGELFVMLESVGENVSSMLRRKAHRIRLPTLLEHEL